MRAIHSHLGRGTWPPSHLANHWEEVELWRALREHNTSYLHGFAQSPDGGFTAPANTNRRYIQLPFAGLITKTSTTLVCGGDHAYRAGKEQDQARLDEIVRINKIKDKVKEAADLLSSEARCFAVVGINDTTPRGRRVPLINIISTSRVDPTIVGGELIDATVITTRTFGPDTENRVMRLFEKHEAGTITYSVWVGTSTEQGSQVPVSQWKEMDPTFTVADSIPNAKEVIQQTGVDELLVVMLSNRDGKSDFQGIEQLLMAANAAFTVGLDAYLASAPVLGADVRMLDEDGNLPWGVTVVPMNLQSGVGEGSDPLKVFQTKFESAAMTEYQDFLFNLTLTNGGIDPSLLGRDVKSGGPESGIALKLKSGHSLSQAEARRDALEEGFSELLRLSALMDVQSFGAKAAVAWTDAAALPTIQLKDGLPVDEMEGATRAATLRAAGLASIEAALEIARPELSEEQRTEEAKRIKDEESAKNEQMAKQVKAAVPEPTEKLSLDDL